MKPAKHSYHYDIAKSYVKDKDKAITTFIHTSLDKTIGMFAYTGLPETIPAKELENILQAYGHTIIAEHNGSLYALSGNFSGEEDVYGNARFYTVANVALKLSKTYEIGKDCVLVKNDFHTVGLLPVIMKYGALMLDTELTLNTIAILSRVTMLISAPDDKTKRSADVFLKHITDGDFSIIGENGFFDGIRLQTADTGNKYVTSIVELMQYYKASFLNEIGLQANFNMKRERLVKDEVLMNIDSLFPFIDEMYTSRLEAVQAINEMFDLSVSIDYAGVWKTAHEQNDKAAMLSDTDNPACPEDAPDVPNAPHEPVKSDEQVEDYDRESIAEDVQEALPDGEDANSDESPSNGDSAISEADEAGEAGEADEADEGEPVNPEDPEDKEKKEA